MGIVMPKAPLNFGLKVDWKNEMLHPLMKKNYGKWAYHEHVKPGVIKWVAESGDVLYAVRCAVPKFVNCNTIRKICDIADEYGEGYFRITSRVCLEFLLSDEKKIDPLIEKLQKEGFPVGGTGRSFKSIVQCVAWIHCHTAATDSSGIAKAIYDELYDLFFRDDLPAKLKMAVSGCLNMCGAVHCSDISVLGAFTAVPEIDDITVARWCEVPTMIKACPTYAIRPKPFKWPDGKPGTSIEIEASKCMHCAICYSLCPGANIIHPEKCGVSIWAGGKAFAAEPVTAKMIVPFLPNNPPRWPEVVKIVKKIVDLWMKEAKPGERVGDWIERIGWEKFFEKMELPFKLEHIDDFEFASYETWRHDTKFKWTKDIKTFTGLK